MSRPESSDSKTTFPDDLELSWKEGRPIPMGEWPTDDIDLLNQSALIDLENSSRRSEKPETAQIYLNKFPQLNPLPLIQCEWNYRIRRGEQVDLAYYLDAFPAHVSQLQEMWQQTSAASTTLSYGPGHETPPPLKFGRFNIEEQLGRGAFGVVYRAWDPDTDRMVAIKVPRFDSEERRARFIREARSTAQLHHPNIVPVYEVGQSDGMPYLVTRFLDGVPLSRAMKDYTWGFRDIARLIRSLSDALDHAHQSDIVHRDVKPDNVLLESVKLSDDAPPNESDNIRLQSSLVSTVSDVPVVSTSLRPCLLDFGLAYRSEEDETMTREGDLLGTPAYMSPEQALGRSHQADGRSDVFSLGVVMYEMLTGDRPFRGNLTMLTHQIIHDEPVSPRRLNDRIPRELETICHRALSKNLPRRFTARELADDLGRWLDGRPIAASPVTDLERAWRWAKRNPRVAVLATSLFMVLTIGLGVVSWFWSEAHNARVLSQQNEARARKSRISAINAFVTMVETSRDELGDLPSMFGTRNRLLMTASNGFNGLKLDDAGEDPELEVAMIGAYLEMGILLKDFSNEGGLDQSLEMLHEAKRLAIKTQSQPPSHDEQLRLAEVLDRLGESQLSANQFDDGLRSLEQANVIMAELALQPDESNVWELWGEILSRLGYYYELLEDWPSARSYYTQAYEIIKRLNADDPTDDSMLDMCRSEQSIADVHLGLAEYDEALRFYRLVRQRLETIDEPLFLRRPWQRLRIVNANHLAPLALANGEVDEAKRFLDDSLLWTNELYRLDPNNLEVWRDQCVVHEQLVEYYQSSGQFEEVQRHCHLMAEFGQKRLDADSSNMDAIVTVGQASGYLGRAFHGKGRFDEAAKKYAEAERMMTPLEQAGKLSSGQLSNLSAIRGALKQCQTMAQFFGNRNKAKNPKLPKK